MTSTDRLDFHLGEQIPVEKWEKYWIEKMLRPFEVKMLSRKRCKTEVVEKAEQARAVAQSLLQELGVTEPEDKIFKFTVSPGIEGMAWGGFARVRHEKIMQWEQTWLS